MSRSETISELAAALCQFQSEIESVEKGSEGYNYNYSDLNAVIKCAKPILVKCGLSVSQLLGGAPNEIVTINTILMHVSGEYIGSEVTIPQLQSNSMNNCQAAGASISYFRRYAYQAILGMSSEDNDAADSNPKPVSYNKNQYPQTQGMP